MTALVRIQLKRTKGWRMPPNTVKVDRTTPWGNPIQIGAQVCAGGDEIFHGEATAEIAVALFRQYLARELCFTPFFLDPLRGKNLACWCNIGTPCHADVLLNVAKARSDAQNKT